MNLEICIDVDDVARAVEFYGRGIGLTIAQQEAGWAKASLGDQVFWIMKAPAGPAGAIARDFKRHWTPVHLDFAVDLDIDSAVKRALDAGGKLEGEIQRKPDGGGLANLSDPSGNGVDLVYRPRK
jgi:predicted enzyme related to lactoylglutathione lyase